VGSLKEIKTRIQSVKSTQKITSAMKMVSSAKLTKAQRTINNFYPYQQKMNELLQHLLLDKDEDVHSVFAHEREVKHLAIVVFASNSSLCGSFNANVIKMLFSVLEQYKSIDKKNIVLYPVGKKIAKACSKLEFKIAGDFEKIADKPNYEELCVKITNVLMHKFENQELDKVEMIYHHFQSKGSQILLNETLLPFKLPTPTEHVSIADYIVEPNIDTVLLELIPKVVRVNLFTALLDSNASEHAARLVAMQTATDNADELLSELSTQYNKLRQQAITNELLDIIGGSFA
jgi:F-type H+-transporting ATPase subunit gamma